MVFLQLFKTLEGKTVQVEMMNGIIVKGTLQSADHYYNFRLENLEVLMAPFCSELYALTTMYIRGSAVRYLILEPNDVDLELLRDATRRHNQGSQ